MLLKNITYYSFRLSLNLKCINLVHSPNSNDSNNHNIANPSTLSSGTYHTAASACSTNSLPVEIIDQLMSDSGVELRPSSRPHDESDISSNEDSKVYLTLNSIHILSQLIFYFNLLKVWMNV